MGTFLRIAVAAVSVVGAASCGGDSGDSPGGDAATVKPFSEVQAGELVFEADPSDPSRGVFRVTTTEAMICAIVWGEDDTYGRLNNSLAMNGTGIEQHDVVLPDLEPGVEYHYVVQGTTADGTLYRSEPGRFLIGAAAPAAATGDRRENLAVGASVIDVSSVFSDGFAGEHAIDGDTSTEWATSGDGDDGFITIDLGSDQALGGIEFVTRSMADGSAITDTFTVTVDDQTTVGPFAAGTVANPRFAEIALTGRLLRFDVESSTGGNVGAVEIRVFGPSP